MKPAVLLLLAAVFYGCHPKGAAVAETSFQRVEMCDSVVGTSDTLRLGIVHSGENLIENIDIVNIGNAPVVVERTECGCACLRTEFDYAPVMPGQSRGMRILFDTYGLSGQVVRRVDIYRAGCDVPYRVWIEAQVRP